ncbi:Uncharacterized protein OBRU01_17283 [Operophtera brumata]|uniref:Uncharacterized protein n=1 Tax=Operophtera brumata TaxID=104452 RepID=A0A0L7L1M1_OPEBR|nr:Uncharacterized protein OBRU01_17283 [Operophtera brumata]
MGMSSLRIGAVVAEWSNLALIIRNSCGFKSGRTQNDASAHPSQLCVSDRSRDPAVNDSARHDSKARTRGIGGPVLWRMQGGVHRPAGEARSHLAEGTQGLCQRSRLGWSCGVTSCSGRSPRETPNRRSKPWLVTPRA